MKSFSRNRHKYRDLERCLRKNPGMNSNLGKLTVGILNCMKLAFKPDAFFFSHTYLQTHAIKHNTYTHTKYLVSTRGAIRHSSARMVRKSHMSPARRRKKFTTFVVMEMECNRSATVPRWAEYALIFYFPVVARFSL